MRQLFLLIYLIILGGCSTEKINNNRGNNIIYVDGKPFKVNPDTSILSKESMKNFIDSLQFQHISDIGDEGIVPKKE